MHIVVIDASNDDITSDGLLDDSIDFVVNGRFLTDTPGSTLAWDRYLHGKHYITARSVPEMVDRILSKLGSESLERLTIWGHGAPGRQGMGAGDSRFNIGWASLGILICVVNGQVSESASLRRLCGRFSWDGRVDLHGCNVALHHSGRHLLRALCDLWQVPVRAGVNFQHSHDDDRFDGPVIEAFPRQGHGSRVHLMNRGSQ